MMMLASSISSRARAQAQPVDPRNPYETTVHARPKRDPGAAIVITAKELKDRGATTLAEALDLIPQIQIRQGGRGDFRLDMRGAKQRSILILIDGVPVDEPWFGAYDLSSIPITDIVQISIQLWPASPLEGPGGDAGIVEVMTMRASGGKRVDARLVGSSQPGFDLSITGRTPLTDGLSMRASGGGNYYHPEYPLSGMGLPPKAVFHDTRDQGHAALRVEELVKNWRLTLDETYEHREFYVPPSQDTLAAVEHVKSEHAARLLGGAEGQWERGRLALSGYYSYLTRQIDYFTDYTLASIYNHEYLSAEGAGAAVFGDWNWRRGVHSLTVSARGSVDWERAHDLLGGVPDTSHAKTWSEIAAGVKYDWRRLRTHVMLDAALGVLAPFGQMAPWPEARLRLVVENDKYGFALVGARKGRLPTLRELYAPMQGNPTLRPEMTWHGELQAWARPHKLVQLRVAGYWRNTVDLIRQSGPGMPGFVNLDEETVCGVEPAIEIAGGKIVGFGVAYLYGNDICPPTTPEIVTHSPIGDRVIENFPRHRLDAWLSSNWRGRAGGLLRFRWIDDQLDQGSPLPNHYVFDLTAWVKLSKNLRASLRIDNLTNNSYYVRSGVLALPTTMMLAFEGTWE